MALYGKDLGTIDARDLLNLNVSWEGIAGSSVDLSAFATNVTDEEYFQYVPGLRPREASMRRSASLVCMACAVALSAFGD